MKYLSFLIGASFDDFSRNKVRTFLTSLGIMIGVLSVVLLIAFGLGLRNYIQNQFESIGTNLLYVIPARIVGEEGGGFQAAGSANVPRFEEKDVIDLEKITNVDYVAPALETFTTVSSKDEEKYVSLILSDENINPSFNLEADLGRLISRSDVDKRSKVAVIGPDLASDLFGSVDLALGETVRISEQNFRVIGITKPKGGGALGGPSFDSIVYIPYKSSLRINPDKKFSTLYIRANTEDDIPQVKQDAEKILSKTYELDDEFQVVEQSEFLNLITSIFSVLNYILIAIGSISLVVGGIGIMNIMYATVTERIKEIGIRRALGATKSDILFQFLAESVILSVFGGAAGLILAFIIVLAIQQFFPAEVNFVSVVAALSVSSAIGIFFGVFPARRAANLVPIEAIRYE
jgi:putative ABC transport system permease protein